MKKVFGLLLGLVLYGNTVNAQTGTDGLFIVKGQVADSLSGETLPYATVGIAFSQTPGQFIKALACDGDGKFEVQIKEAGNYVMSIQSVGYLAAIHTFTLSETNKDVNLGRITMRENIREIKEATVSAQRPLVKVEIDKIIYSTEDDPESKVNNTLDMLRKVPLVTVDGEDKIQLKGSANFKIYLNGKPSNMFNGQNVSNVLKSMPASSVKNIEVITDPGARYDAEGIGGIINIVTARNAFQGYSGSVNANAGTFGSYYGGVYLTAKAGKFGLTGNFNHNNFRRPWGSTENTGENFINDRYYRETSTGKSRNKGIYNSGYLEASYEIDTLNLLSLGANLYGGNSENTSEWEIEMQNRAGEPVYGYERNGTGKYGYGSTGFNFDYQRSTRKKGEYLTVSYRFSNSPNDSENQAHVDNVAGEIPAYMKRNQWTVNDATTREHTGQFDYVNPVNKRHSIEAGVKYILRQNISNAKQYEMPASDTEWNLLPPKDNNDFNHSSHIYAGYVGYAYKADKIGFRTGLRAEGTRQSVKFRLNEAMNFNTPYFNVVPSVTASWQINAAQQIRLGYNLRIYRPGIWYLNPYVNDIDPFNISYGNPELDVEKSHGFNLNYSYFSRKLTLNASASYAYVNNSINRYSFIDPEQPNVKQQTYGNTGKNQRAGIYANIGWTPVAAFRLNLNGGLNYTDMKSAELEQANSGLTGNIYATAQLTLPKDFRISVNGLYYSGFIMLQGEESSYFYTIVSFNKDFMKKKLTVSLSCVNPTAYTLNYTYSVSDKYFATNTAGHSPIREGRIGISYRFGTMKESIKKVQRGITNDDVKGGGSGGGSSEGAGGGGAM
jgi:hypothetical protein